MKMISTNERAALAHKILFVTSSRDGKDPKDAPAYTARLAGFLMSKRVPNDGLLYEKDQKIPGLGEHLMSIRKASHFNLTADFGPADCRKDFTRFLILKLATSAQP
jgi:hypothetical protein